MTPPDTDDVIDEFLGGTPRASEWHEMREALTARLVALRAQRRQEQQDGVDDARLRTLDLQVASLDRQVAALKTEEAVSTFVEDSIKVALARSLPEEE